MLKIIKPLTIVLFLVCFNAIAFSQSAGQKSSGFVSKEGGFTIDLPGEDVKKSTTAMGRAFATAAFEHKWDNDQGYFVVTYADLTEELDNHEAFLKLVSQSLVDDMGKEGGKLKSERALMLDGNHGYEVVINLKGGMVGIGRYYLVKKRVYTIFSGWKNNENGEKQLKILDSFKLLKS